MTSDPRICTGNKGSKHALTFLSLLSIPVITLVFSLFMLGQAQLSAAETPKALLEALQERNTEIDTREATILAREGQLDLLEKEIRGMLDEYIKLKEIVDQKTSEETLAKQKKREARVNRLSKIYQSMDAKIAAQRIKRMKRSTALSLLRKIKEKQAAKILSNMSATAATQFSEAFIRADQ